MSSKFDAGRLSPFAWLLTAALAGCGTGSLGVGPAGDGPADRGRADSEPAAEAASPDAGPGEDPTPDPPAGWTCEPRWWGEGWCDCGCGALDTLDCVDGELESCVYNACRGESRPDPEAPTSCQPSFFSCHPDHVWADQLPRRYALPEDGKRR